jgi:hypothetical protein
MDVNVIVGRIAIPLHRAITALALPCTAGPAVERKGYHSHVHAITFKQPTRLYDSGFPGNTDLM